MILMLSTSVNLNEFLNPYFLLYKILSNYFNSDYLKVQTIQIDFCLSKLYFMLCNIRTEIEQIQCINKPLADWLSKGPFKNNVTSKLQNFRPSSPYVTVSHFFHSTPSYLCHQTKSDILFPRLKTLNNNLTHFV